MLGTDSNHSQTMRKHAKPEHGMHEQLSGLFSREQEFVTEHFRESGIPLGQIEDHVQDFFLELLEWAQRNGRSEVGQEDLVVRMEVFLRTHRRKSPRPGVGAWECLDVCPDAPRGVERTVDVDFEQAMIDREQVVRYLACMTEKSQLAVIIYYLVGLTREEMADLWGVSANTVATQAFRGIRQARSYGPRVPLDESADPVDVVPQRVDLPMEWGSIPLELSERSADLVCPWYDPQRARQRWNRRTPMGPAVRPVMLWPQPVPRSRRASVQDSLRNERGNDPESFPEL